jgi:Tol biopolymer transport system component
MDVFTGERQILRQYSNSVQAPNWTPDGKTLIYNSKGLLYNYDLATGKISVLNTGTANANNNDHVLSFDGKYMGISSNHTEKDKRQSVIYYVPIEGGEPHRVTDKSPSYLHGWSPDGKYLTYTAERNGDYDIYVIPKEGGEEIQLTTAPGLDDGSEYTPDGNYIYFNSVRTGMMQIWRMKPDGSEQEQVTFDNLNNWFPHISPDGKWIVFLTFNNDVAPGDHPFYKHVYLRMMPVSGGKPKVIAYLYGGQGTINVPSWSPDSRKIAFVSNSDGIE